MRVFRYHTFLFIPGIVLCVACNEPFSPKGVFDEKMVVYSVIVSGAPAQFVRVYENYNPPGFDATAINEDNPDTNAVVSMTDGSAMITFADTTLSRQSQARYRTPIRTFISRSMPVLPGQMYSLDVVSQQFGSIRTSTNVPGSGSVYCFNPYILTSPSTSGRLILAVMGLAGNDAAYQVRLVVVFGLRSDSAFDGVREVPVQVHESAGGGVIFIYPGMTRKSVSPTNYLMSELFYVYTLEQIINTYGIQNVIFRHATFYLIQADQNLFAYYTVANAFQDPYSTRLDQPDFTNIPGGLGVFGSCTIDSAVYDLPETIRIDSTSTF